MFLEPMDPIHLGGRLSWTPTFRPKAIVGLGAHHHNNDNNFWLLGSGHGNKNNTWTERTKSIASDGEAGDRFGFNVAVDGEGTVAVGASHDDNKVKGRGSAYIFEVRCWAKSHNGNRNTCW